MLWEVGEQAEETECIVNVSQCVHKAGISLLYHMSQRILRRLLYMVLCQLQFFLAQKFFVFLEMGFDVSELLEEFVMHEDLEVFDVIIGLRRSLKLLLGLARIDSLEDTESTEVFQRQLQLADCFASSEVLRLLSLLALLYFLH